MATMSNIPGKTPVFVSEKPSQATKPVDGQIIFLEYFRIYAFVAVFIDHKFPGWHHMADGPDFTFRHLIATVYDAFMPLLTNGQGGVIIFFLISGYIIAAKIETEPVGTFFIKRIFRIYPLYIFVLLCQYSVHGRGHMFPDWHTLLEQFTLTGDFTGTGFGLDVEWTLRIEVLFYMFATILCLLSQFKYRYKTIVWSLVATAALCVMMPAFPSWSPNTIGRFNQFFPFLMLGMILYYFEIRKCSALLLGVVAALALAQMTAGSMSIFMLCIFGIGWLVREHMPNYRWVPIVSSITYPFYLLHLWLYDNLIQLYKLCLHNVFVCDVLAILSLVFACYVAHYLVERPFIGFGRQLTNRLGKPRAWLPRWYSAAWSR